MDVTVEAYRITSSFPKAETFGISSQIRRAAASVPANIAEGWGRQGTKEFIQFLRVAQGSLNELETHLILAQRLNLLSNDQPLFPQISTTSKMLLSLIRSLQRRMPLEK